ncbi:hypothetical protein WAF00_02890 [Mameliella alba]|uniref:carph-isopro domain-containing protein n=1 Tax=Mameliella alba TaxID=561184 RepID=UPI001557DBD3|nr:hypothetical protein [Mameliella alba]
MSYVNRIVEAFGGVRPMAKAAGYPVSTVQSWKSRGSIPDDRKADIWDAAKAAGVTLTPAHFVPFEETPASPAE